MTLRIKPAPARHFRPEVDEVISANSHQLIAERFRHFVGEAGYTDPNDWADEFRHMSVGSRWTRWSTARTPYLREIGKVVASDDPAHKYVCIAKGAQLGFSEFVLNFILMRIAENPCSILYYTETIEKAKAWAKTRLMPALKLPPFNDSAEYQLYGDSLNFPNGFLNWYGAGSSTSVSSTSSKIVIADEISKYKTSIDGEGDWLSLAAERTGSYGDAGAKIILLSTPGDEGLGEEGSFHGMVHRGDWRQYKVPCQHCGDLWLWDIKDVIKYEEDGEVHYGLKCPNKKCGKITRDGPERDEATAKGSWHATKEPREGFVSFQISTLYAPSSMRSLSDLYNRYEEAITGTGGSLKSFYNTRLGLFYSHPSARTPLHTDAALRMTKDVYKKGVVPNEASILTCGIDVQAADGGFLVWEVRAWADRFENWSIDKGRIDIPISDTERVVKALKEMMAKIYPRADGKGGMKIRMSAIDYSYQSTAVRALLNHFPKPDWDAQRTWVPTGSLVALKGNNKAENEKLILSVPGDKDARGQRKRHVFVLVGTDVAKKELYLSLSAPLEGEDGKPAKKPFGMPHAPTDEAYNEAYFQELTCETVVVERHAKTGALQTVFRKPDRAKNEAIDTYVYGRTAIQLLGADQWKTEKWDAVREREIIAKIEKKNDDEPQLTQQQLRERIKQKRRREQEERRRRRLSGK